MTTSKLVETCNVEALDPTEAKAAFLSLYKQQRHWIEITDDPATWPPLNTWVAARHIRGFDLFYAEGVVKYLNGQWRTIRGNYASFRDEPTHWRPI